MSSEKPLRGAAYIDGFNLYHAIDDLRVPHLKWLDLRKLSVLIARGHSHTIEKVVFCTAYFPGDHGKKKRHETYVAALQAVGTQIEFGHTTKEPMQCPDRNCGHRWDAGREKETDINLALSIFEDAVDDVFDVAFIVTADTDQAATLKRVRKRYPQKRLIAVAPPGRPSSKHLRDLTDATITLTEDHIDCCAFPNLIQSITGKSVLRPREYSPPAGWIHPDDRPKKVRREDSG